MYKTTPTNEQRCQPHVRIVHEQTKERFHECELTSPHTISYVTHPRHHQSTARPYACFLSTSGARYCKTTQLKSKEDEEEEQQQQQQQQQQQEGEERQLNNG